jgi:hypothetical protein
LGELWNIRALRGRPNRNRRFAFFWPLDLREGVDEELTNMQRSMNSDYRKAFAISASPHRSVGVVADRGTGPLGRIGDAIWKSAPPCAEFMLLDATA